MSESQLGQEISDVISAKCQSIQESRKQQMPKPKAARR